MKKGHVNAGKEFQHVGVTRVFRGTKSYDGYIRVKHENEVYFLFSQRVKFDFNCLQFKVQTMKI